MKLMPLLLTGLLCMVCSVSYAQNWQFYRVDEGVKPALDLSRDGTPHISYMLEDFVGFVKHATWNPVTSSFDLAEVSVGYFYGPLALDVDPNDVPHISYHDHTFEDQVHAVWSGSQWQIERIPHDGHDGWDNAIVVDEQNRIHTSSVDPVDFGGAGVEYAVFDGSRWEVEAIGSGPIMYANTTALALDRDSNPHILYYDDTNGDLWYAVKTGGQWNRTRILSEGDVGRFSSMQIDAADVPHISFYEHNGDRQGYVNYAFLNRTTWEHTRIDTLDNVFLGFSGARNMTSLALDAQGQPHITYGDTQHLRYAKRIEGTSQQQTWQRQTILDASGAPTPLGQLTSLKLDEAGNPHVAYFEVTRQSPLRGVVHYATLDATEVNTEPVERAWETALSNYPNPFRESTQIAFTLSTGGPVSLKVYDLQGRVITTLVDTVQPSGRYSLPFESASLSNGLYFYTLKSAHQTITRTMVLAR